MQSGEAACAEDDQIGVLIVGGVEDRASHAVVGFLDPRRGVELARPRAITAFNGESAAASFIGASPVAGPAGCP